jgi:signal transduction histidine kinase
VAEFLANMSHELRTPLNAILGYTELMADGAYGEPSEKMLGILKPLEANGRHLLGLINDVLDLSKIEAGQLVLELSDYSIQDIAQTVRSTLEPLAADKKLAFKVEVAPQLPPGPIDQNDEAVAIKATTALYHGMIDMRPADPVEGIIISQLMAANQSRQSISRRTRNISRLPTRPHGQWCC